MPLLTTPQPGNVLSKRYGYGTSAYGTIPYGLSETFPALQVYGVATEVAIFGATSDLRVYGVATEVAVRVNARTQAGQLSGLITLTSDGQQGAVGPSGGIYVGWAVGSTATASKQSLGGTNLSQILNPTGRGSSGRGTSLHGLFPGPTSASSFVPGHAQSLTGSILDPNLISSLLKASSGQVDLVTLFGAKFVGMKALAVATHAGILAAGALYGHKAMTSDVKLSFITGAGAIGVVTIPGEIIITLSVEAVEQILSVVGVEQILDIQAVEQALSVHEAITVEKS